MIERGQDRRRARAWYSSLTHDRRRQGYDRRDRGGASAMPGMVRPGFGEAQPVRERRRFPDAGME